MNPNLFETPLTDKQAELGVGPRAVVNGNAVSADFARKLERALRQIHDLTYPYADGAVDADAHSKLCARISDITRDFIKP